MYSFFNIFKFINEAHSAKPVTTIRASDGSQALGPARGVAGTDVTSTVPRSAVPPAPVSPSAACETIHLPLMKALLYMPIISSHNARFNQRENKIILNLVV